MSKLSSYGTRGMFREQKNTAYGNWHMAQSWPKKHQLQRSDFSQNYFAMQ